MPLPPFPEYAPMLASELAQELGIDPSIISKRLKTYFKEIGEEKPRHLDKRAVGDMQQAHELLAAKKARSFNEALQMVVGTFVEPLPPESVRLIESRLVQLEHVQAEMLKKVDLILQYMEASLARRAAQGGAQGQ